MPGNDILWETALDWSMRMRATPDDAALSSALNRWLAESAEHARAYRKAQKVWQLTGDLTPSHAHLWRPTVDATSSPAYRSRRVVMKRWAAGIAAALLLVPTLWLMSRADYRTGVAQVEQVTLNDGSIVNLDAQSALDVQYSAAGRAVTLRRGEALFDVRHDPTRPFTVHVNEFDITVVGTAFDVRVSDGSFTVAVARGAVRVSGPGMQDALLRPGSRLTAALEGTGPVRTDTVPVTTIDAWRDGRLMVYDAPLGEVVDALNRHYRGSMLLMDDELKSRRVTGIYDLQRPVDALATLVRPFGSEVRLVTRYLAVVSAKK